MDKLDKIGVDGVAAELKEKAFDEAATEKLMSVIAAGDLSLEKVTEIAEVFLQESFDPVSHTVKSGHSTAFFLFLKISVNNTREGRVDRSSRAAGLSDNRRTT